jgi:hypothetical protein
MDFPSDFDVDSFLAPFRAKYGAGEVVAIMTACGPAAFRGPTSPEYVRIKAMAQSVNDRAAASKTLCLMCVLEPSREVFGTWCDRKPGIVDVCDDHIFELAGIDKAAAVKK